MTRNRGRGCSLKRILEDIGIDMFVEWKQALRREYDDKVIDEISKRTYWTREIKDKYVMYRYESKQRELHGT